MASAGHQQRCPDIRSSWRDPRGPITVKSLARYERTANLDVDWVCTAEPLREGLVNDQLTLIKRSFGRGLKLIAGGNLWTAEDCTVGPHIGQLVGNCEHGFPAR